MELYTPVLETPWSNPISCEETITVLGSCFAAELGKQMENLQLPVCNNPFGVLYNPASVAKSIHYLLPSDFLFSQKDVIARDNGWTSFSHHGSFTSSTPVGFLSRANNALILSRLQFAASTRVVVSLGTAWCYRHLETNQIVSNCHKIPAKEFQREFLEVEEAVACLAEAIRATEQAAQAGKIQPKEWIFTVSPIRHRKDGLHDNQLSKATLQLAVRQLQAQFDHVRYFPAYEILLDELRDYRYYAEDLVHPSTVAVRYIWERFVSTAYAPAQQEELRQREKQARQLHHRPIQKN
ncbi:MAG: GSCFA domain-containing protein [Bacteroidales bacterium]|nr:GSCFA domain-containing protein [Bacteroidales bacterium]